MEINKKDVATKVAILYYEKNKTQNNIAKELNISRSYVSQLLSFAREKGIVQISIHVDEFSLRMIRKEIEFKKLFPSLKQVFIMNSKTEDFTTVNLGKFAAPYISELINDAKTIGINPGVSVEKTVEHLGNQSIIASLNQKVVQMMGGYNSSADSFLAHPNEITKKLGDVLSCKSYYLNCPALVEQQALREQLIKEKSIQYVMTLWDQIDLAIMGLGVVDERSKLFNLFNAQAKGKILNSRACGVINTSYFDKHGTFIPLFEKNKIGISIETLKKIPNKVIICSGKYKSNALLGALRGEIADVLITDSLTVESVEEKFKTI